MNAFILQSEECGDVFPGAPPGTAMMCLPTNEPGSSGDEGAKIIRGEGGDFVRQPCKARGVSIKPGQNPHVARHAYIDIPMGTMHGTVLSCSHPVCIASGRRFRYCVHCKTAVAKRNFNVRHAHGSLNSPPPKMMISSSPTSPIPPPVCESAVVSDSEDKPEVEEPINPGVPSVISVDDHKSLKSVTEDYTATTNVPLNPREIELLNMFRSRPGDDYPHEVERWKMALLALAEAEPVNARPSAISIRTYPPPSMNSDSSSVASYNEEKEGNFEDFDFSMMVVDCFGLE